VSVEAGSGLTADPLAVVRRHLREELRRSVDARGLATVPRTERRVRVREEARELLRASGAILPQRELTRMVNEVSDEVVGFGPIEALLKDPDVTEGLLSTRTLYRSYGGQMPSSRSLIAAVTASGGKRSKPNVQTPDGPRRNLHRRRPRFASG
jgi:hypothetical protein